MQNAAMSAIATATTRLNRRPFTVAVLKTSRCTASIDSQNNGQSSIISNSGKVSTEPPKPGPG